METNQAMPRTSKKGLGRNNSGIIRVRVPSDLLRAWQEVIAASGEDGPEVLRRLIAQLADRPISAPKSSESVGLEPVPMSAEQKVDRAPKKAVKLMLTQNEYSALREIAEARDCSIQFWIVSLIRAALTRGITVGGAELEALGNSNYELAAIGRNLNQIARRLNTKDGVDVGRLISLADELWRKIETNRREVHALVNACSHRWKLKTSEGP